ncbi:MAG TPA: hypothetical protein PKM88_03865 [bacterium]|nr:hypothetical protein [bacterium]
MKERHTEPDGKNQTGRHTLSDHELSRVSGGDEEQQYTCTCYDYTPNWSTGPCSLAEIQFRAENHRDSFNPKHWSIRFFPPLP